MNEHNDLKSSAGEPTLKEKIEKILSDILSDKHDAKIKIEFVAKT